MRGDSATADEPQHIAAGLLKLGQGRLDFSRDQLPLMESISVAPLLLQGHRLPPLSSLRGDSWSMGKVFLFRSGGDPRALLAAARLPTLAMFFALIVAMYAFVAAESGSRAWGLCAAALIAFCPNLLAHGRLVTTDLPVAFFCFAAAAAFLRLLRRPQQIPSPRVRGEGGRRPGEGRHPHRSLFIPFRARITKCTGHPTSPSASRNWFSRYRRYEKCSGSSVFEKSAIVGGCARSCVA